MTIKRGYKQLLAEANAEVETMPVRDAIALLGQPDTVFVDLRDPREMEREGRMPGAFACTRGMLEFWIDPESPYAKPIFAEKRKFVFFCAGGWRSALAAKTAQDSRTWDWTTSPMWKAVSVRGNKPAARLKRRKQEPESCQCPEPEVRNAGELQLWATICSVFSKDF